mgnify:CR=1 FL=1
MKDKELRKLIGSRINSASGIESDTALCRREDGSYRFYNPAL